MGSEQQRKALLLPRKLLRRFYEPLLLLKALGPIRGDRIKPNGHVERDELNHRRARRAFADGIAYICAYQRGPEKVTAACLERKPSVINVLLAANSDIDQEVHTFLTDILSSLSLIGQSEDFSRDTQANSMFVENLITKVIVFNKARIQQYYSDTKRLLPACLDILRSSSRSTGTLETWFEEHFVRDCELGSEENQMVNALVNSCYLARKGSLFECLKAFSRQGETRFQDFERLFKLLYKLSKHVAVVKQLVDAVVLLPQDFGYGFEITIIPSSQLRKFPLNNREAQVQCTADRAFSNIAEKEKFLRRLQSIWDTDELSRLQQEKITTKTRVHAEILVVDHIDKNGCEFLDGYDRYVGCSKPACYLCYAYFTHHPGRYATPASHQKLYVGWRLPDIYSDESNAQERLESQNTLLRSLITQTRNDLAAEIESRNPRRPYHPDSTAGITTTVAEDIHDLLQLETCSLHDDQTSPQTRAGKNVSREIEEIEESSEDEGGVSLI